jgi:hypothetical protein
MSETAYCIHAIYRRAIASLIDHRQSYKLLPCFKIQAIIQSFGVRGNYRGKRKASENVDLASDERDSHHLVEPLQLNS